MSKKKESKQKKINVRVDFTPMVDMLMLLITFFMLCTTLSKPQTMELTLPSNDENIDKDDKNEAKASQTVTLYLDSNPVATQDNFVLASKVSTKADSYKTLKLGDGWGGNNAYGFHNMSIDEYRITRRALAPQEFLMAGAAPASGTFDPTRAWIGFEGDLSVKPDEGAIPEGSSSATTVTMEYTSLVPGIRLIDGNGNLIRASNAS